MPPKAKAADSKGKPAAAAKKVVTQWKKIGYYEPWIIDLPWEDIRYRINRLNAQRVKPEKRTINLQRGLEFYENQRILAAKAAAQAAAAASSVKGKKKGK